MYLYLYTYIVITTVTLHFINLSLDPQALLKTAKEQLISIRW